MDDTFETRLHYNWVPSHIKDVAVDTLIELHDLIYTDVVALTQNPEVEGDDAGLMVNNIIEFITTLDDLPCGNPNCNCGKDTA